MLALKISDHNATKYSESLSSNEKKVDTLTIATEEIQKAGKR